jgi:integrase/recombinase XerD
VRKIVDYDVFKRHVNPDNKTLAKDFLIEKRSQGKSDTTISGYRNDMNIILYMVYQHFDNKMLTDLTRKDIRNLSIIFQEMGMSNARVNRLMSTLRSCLEFCADDDDYEYEFNVGSRVKGLPKVPVREITFLEHEQVEWLIDEALRRKKTMMAMYLALSYYSAKRKSEVHQVLKDGLTEKYFTNIVKGKGSKKFRLYYNDRVRDIIRQYLEERGPDDIPHLFVKVYKNGDKRVVTKHAYAYWCQCFSKWLSDREGRNIPINPHCFRHSRLENLRQQGIPIEKLKTLANHSDISTTESYLADRSEDDIADIFGMDPSCFKS